MRVSSAGWLYDLGGDCDTLTCIACSIAEAFYGMPGFMREECIKRLPEDMLGIIGSFSKNMGKNKGTSI